MRVSAAGSVSRNAALSPRSEAVKLVQEVAATLQLLAEPLIPGLLKPHTQADKP